MLRHQSRLNLNGVVAWNLRSSAAKTTNTMGWSHADWRGIISAQRPGCLSQT